MLYPLKKPKMAYTIQAIMQTLIIVAVFYVIHKTHSMAKILLPIGMFFSAFGRSFLVVPRVINLNNSDPNTDSFSLSLWFTLTFLGDVAGVLFVQYLLKIGVTWNYAFMAYMILFLAIALLHHFFIDEIEVEEVQE